LALRDRDIAEELADRWQSGTVIFASTALVHVAVGRQQLTFSCDGSGLGRGAVVEVGGLWLGWNGSLGARRLRVGERELTLRG
jgi:hypothetical protein